MSAYPSEIRYSFAVSGSSKSIGPPSARARLLIASTLSGSMLCPACEHVAVAGLPAGSCGFLAGGLELGPLPSFLMARGNVVGQRATR